MFSKLFSKFSKSDNQLRDVFLVDKPLVARRAYSFECADDKKTYYATSTGVIIQYYQKGNGVPQKFYPAKLDKNNIVVEVGEAISLDAKGNSIQYKAKN